MVKYMCEKHSGDSLFDSEKEAQDCEREDEILLAGAKYKPDEMVKSEYGDVYQIIKPFVWKQGGIKKIYYRAIEEKFMFEEKRRKDAGYISEENIEEIN